MSAFGRRPAPPALLAVILPIAMAHPVWSQVFRTRVDVVRLDVSVTRGSTRVTGLTARDFLVTDDGVEQQIEILQREQVPVRVQLAFDVSESVTGQRLSALQTAFGRVLNALRPGDQVGVLTFSHRVEVRAPMTGELASARAALSQVVPGGQTALRDAVALGVALAGGDGARALLILFTDGVDNASWTSAEGLLEAVRRADTVVHVVRVDAMRAPNSTLELPPERFLDRLVDATGGRVWRASSDDDVTRLANSAFGEMRARYVLTYQPKEPRRPGWHELKVRLRNGGSSVRARPGYFAGS